MFLSTLSLSGLDGAITLSSAHESRPQSLVARFVSLPMVFLFRGVMKKPLLQDLGDIKAAVEAT